MPSFLETKRNFIFFISSKKSKFRIETKKISTFGIFPIFPIWKAKFSRFFWKKSSLFLLFHFKNSILSWRGDQLDLALFLIGSSINFCIKFRYHFHIIHFFFAAQFTKSKFELLLVFLQTEAATLKKWFRKVENFESPDKKLPISLVNPARSF